MACISRPGRFGSAWGGLTLFGLFASVGGKQILPAHLLCSISPVKVQLDSSSPLGALLPCGASQQNSDPAFVCCDSEDVEFVLQALEGSTQFLLRHLQDRQAFYDQYRQISLGEHPCAPAVELMVTTRLERLQQSNLISQQMLGLLATSVQHLLCLACRSDSAAKQEEDAAVAAEWSRASKAITQMYGEIRSIDSAIAGRLRETGNEACLLEFGEALRRGVLAPSLDVIPLRPWKLSVAKGGDSFRDVWQRWIDSAVAVAGEFAEGMLAEIMGLLLALGYADACRNGFGSPLATASMDSRRAACELMVRPPSSPASQFSGPPPMATGVFQTSATQGVQAGAGASIDSSKRGWICVDGNVPPKLVLLVRMPNPGTNLRFDFSSDPMNLDSRALEQHAAALMPLASRDSQACVVIVTANPQHAHSFSQFFSGATSVFVVWRRFALFNPDELAHLYAAEASGGFSANAGQVSAVFEVPPGGDALGLASAVKALCHGRADAGCSFAATWQPLPVSSWPLGLRAAEPSPWGSWAVRTAALTAQGSMRAGTPRRQDGVADAQGGCHGIASLLSGYLEQHRAVATRLRAGSTTERLLIYRCSALGFCGGHGDRLNGLLGVFLIAVAAGRAFFIDSPRPMPLSMIFGPRRRPAGCQGDGEFLLDWRMHGAVAAVGRRVNYNDRHNELVDDFPWLLTEEPENVVVMHSNQRITMPLLQSKEAKARLGSSVVGGLLSTPYLHAELMELLFEPTPLIAARREHLYTAALRSRRFLMAIHFRAGDRSPSRWNDPPRHKLEDLDAFLDCAAAAEQRLGWSTRDVSWYLAADTAEAAAWPRVAQLRSQGKLSVLLGEDSAGSAAQDAAIVHLDRSPMELLVSGTAETWAQWLAIASADAVVLSTSGFGVTAAESGRVRHAFLGPHGCLPVDLTAA